MGLKKAYDELLDGPTLVGEASIYDDEGEFTGVQYDTDPNAGVLRTPNAGVRIEGDQDGLGSLSTGSGLELYYDSSRSASVLRSYDEDLATNRTIEYRASLHDFAYGNADLRLATGQAIEDGSGTERIGFGSSTTEIRTPDGSLRFRLRDGGDGIRFDVSDSIPLTVNNTNNDPLAQITNGSPGTLELTNAYLFSRGEFGFDSPSYDIHISGIKSRPSVQIDDGFGNRVALSAENAGNSTSSEILFGCANASGVSKLRSRFDGEIKAEDANGNVTTLT